MLKITTSVVLAVLMILPSVSNAETLREHNQRMLREIGREIIAESRLQPQVQCPGQMHHGRLQPFGECPTPGPGNPPWPPAQTIYGQGTVMTIFWGGNPPGNQLNMSYEVQGFPVSVNFTADFGIPGYNPNTMKRMHGQLQLTDACWNALQALNDSFVTDLGQAGFGVALAIAARGGGTISLLTKGAGFTGLMSAITDLDSKQEAVDTSCAGQGVGRNP